MAIVINGSGTVSGLTEQASNVELTDNTKILVGTGDDFAFELSRILPVLLQ